MTGVADARVFWILNADCELEFDQPKNYQTDAPTARALTSRRRIFQQVLAGYPWAFTFELERQASGRRHAVQPALAWSPTPWALSQARRAGFDLPAGPPLEVLQKANEKAFLSEHLREWAHPQRTVIARGTPWSTVDRPARPVRLRRPFGCAGRGARVVQGVPSADDERFITAALRKGYLVLEPELEISQQWSIHGVVRRDARLIGEPCTFATDAQGSPLGAPERAPHCPRRDELRLLATTTATALLTVGYQGPFGLDVLDTGKSAYAIDLNARFSLGFLVGLGDRLDEALGLCQQPIVP